MTEEKFGDYYIRSNHPWAQFLKIRVKVIKWLREDMRRSHKEIAESLSMDEEQVKAIWSYICEEE